MNTTHAGLPFISTLVYNEMASQTQFTAACLFMGSDKMKVELYSEILIYTEKRCTKYQVRVVRLLVWGIVWLV